MHENLTIPVLALYLDFTLDSARRSFRPPDLRTLLSLDSKLRPYSLKEAPCCGGWRFAWRRCISGSNSSRASRPDTKSSGRR